MSLMRDGEADQARAAAAGGGGASGGGSAGLTGDSSAGLTGDSSSSSSSSSSSPSSAVNQTLENLDQLLGIEAEAPQPADQPAPPQPPPSEQPPAAPRPRRMEEPQITFYDPNEEAGWKYVTRCALVGIVGGTALLLTISLSTMTLWLVTHGIPPDQWGSLAKLRQGECMELPQERMLCRRELDDFKSIAGEKP